MKHSLIISNLPSSCTGYEVNVLLGEIGDIKRSFIVKNDGRFNKTPQAELEFKNPADHEKALKKFNNFEYKGQRLSIKLTGEGGSASTKQSLNATNGNKNTEKSKPLQEKNQKSAKKKLPKKRKLEEVQQEPNEMEESLQNKKSKTNKPSKEKKTNNKPSKDKTKLDELLEKNKVSEPEEKRYHKTQEGRIIVRNLSFKATKEDIKHLFGAHGEIREVNFPQKKGCVFVQFNNKDAAVKAIKECNVKSFMGRFIAVDHAVPKGRFHDTLLVKEIKQEIKEEEEEEEEEEKPEVNNITLEEEDGNKNESLLNSEDIKKEPYFREDPKNFKHKEASKDVIEGRSVFISGLSIDTSKLSLESILGQFGALKYVVLVIDKMTEQPKGTAFAEFRTKEAANACIEASEDPSKDELLSVDSKVISVKKTVSRHASKTSWSGDKVTKVKDKRNMYLAKEGFIREGTQSAVGVSRPDIQFRRERERVKQKLLGNLHNFVSSNRICVNNLPPSLADADLREIFVKYSPVNAKILECRVMRYLSDVDDKGTARSRGYGFVAFKKHEHALTALRTVNNNPEIFTTYKRPIVEFSIENKAILNAKDKRLKNSKMVKENKNNKKTSTTVKKEVTDTSRPQFAGYVAKKGDVHGKKIHKHLGPKIRRRDLNKGNKRFGGKSEGKTNNKKKTFKGKSSK